MMLAENDDDEDDEEEEAVDYRDRVREIQQWMNRRDSERKGEAPTLSLPRSAPSAAPAYPRYFRDNGYDENGYRRLDSEVRTRLRDAPDSSYVRHSYRRHHSWHKRWHRHVRPVYHARRHHYYTRHHHGGHQYYSHHHAHGGRVDKHHGHSFHPGNVHAQAVHGHGHGHQAMSHASAARTHPPAAKTSAKPIAHAKPAAHAKPVAAPKPAQKGRSKR
jgi:hypothetical protein